MSQLGNFLPEASQNPSDAPELKMWERVVKEIRGLELNDL